LRCLEEKPKSMKTQFTLKAGSIFILFFLISFITVQAQVGINTKTPANGALLDISSSDKGLLIPRVALTGTDDVATITPSATTGVMVYNTVTAGALPVQVTPGFYYWNGSQWVRLYNQGYSLYYEQETEVQADADNTIYVILSDLDTGIISIPFSGKYQIRVNVTYCAGDLIVTTYDGAAQGSVSLWIETNGIPAIVPVKENYLTSSSKGDVDGATVDNLGQNTTITWNMDLDVTNTYRFYVQGREWLANNVGVGYFGKNSSAYPGSLGDDDALRGYMNITLVKQQ